MFYRYYWDLMAVIGIYNGGEDEIRTHGTVLPYTRFPGERLQPLGHLSATGKLDEN